MILSYFLGLLAGLAGMYLYMGNKRPTKDIDDEKKSLREKMDKESLEDLVDRSNARQRDRDRR